MPEKKKLWTRTYSTRDQVPTWPVFTRAKIKSRFGILKNLPSQYLHERLNTSKGAIRSRELALATAEEMTAAFGNQGVTNIRRITIRKGEQIQTNTYILTFNQPHTTKEVKISSCWKVYPSTLEVLQMPKIWTPQGSLQKTTNMGKVQWKGPGPHWGR